MRNLFLVIILIITSCTQNNYNESLIKNEILDVTSEYNKVWESLSVEDIAEFHSDKSFIYFWKGQLAANSNQHFRDIFTKILSTTKEWSMKTSQQTIQIIDENTAIISFAIETQSIEMNGTKSNETGALTYVWNKIDGKWKIVHIHES